MQSGGGNFLSKPPTFQETQAEILKRPSKFGGRMNPSTGDSDAARLPHPAAVPRLEGHRRIVETLFDFGDWRIVVLKSPILPSNCYCATLDGDNTRGLVLQSGKPFVPKNSDAAANPDSSELKCQVCRFGSELQLRHFPEMVFPDNILHLLYKPSGLVLEFNTLDAMKLMSATDTNSVHVACAEAWQASKKQMGLPKDVLHDFNWTFITDYKGSLKEKSADDGTVSGSELSFPIEQNTSERLNLEKLMQKEAILFFEELTLFEDELHDNGISNCSVKIRVMPSGFFILLRYYLRVDHVMARVCDTRIHFEKENNYFLRQYQVREQSFKNLMDLDPHIHADINLLYNHLPVVQEVTDKVFITK